MYESNDREIPPPPNPPGILQKCVVFSISVQKLKVRLRVRQFFCFWRLFVALNYCANSFCAPTNFYGFIGLQSCRFGAIQHVKTILELFICQTDLGYNHIQTA